MPAQIRLVVTTPDGSAVDRLLPVHGLPSSQVAYLCDIPQHDVKSFRSSDPACDDPRRAGLYGLLTFLDTLLDQRLTPDPAAWLFTHLFPDHSVTPAVLFRAGKTAELFDCLQTGSDLHATLDMVIPDWRTNTRLGWSPIFTVDGSCVLVRRV